MLIDLDRCARRGAYRRDAAGRRDTLPAAERAAVDHAVAGQRHATVRSKAADDDVSPGIFVGAIPFTETSPGALTMTVAGTPKVSNGLFITAALFDVTRLIMVDAGRPLRFEFAPSAPPSNGVPGTVLLLSASPSGHTPDVWYWLRLIPFEFGAAILTVGVPLLVAVVVGWNEIGARRSTIGAACAVCSERNTTGLRYITHAVTLT